MKTPTTTQFLAWRPVIGTLLLQLQRHNADPQPFTSYLSHVDVVLILHAARYDEGLACTLGAYEAMVAERGRTGVVRTYDDQATCALLAQALIRCRDTWADTLGLPAASYGS